MLSVQTHTENENTASVTNISATARVDYIQRFSKQAVLVVHDDYQVSADVGHQYIAQLPAQSNTAFVSISSKHNDIQIRCRIVEQLFGQQAFDPEVSLAVSLINQLKQESQKLTIVIANAQHLSLQLLHELTQLCEIAKKSDFLVSVLMLSNMETGQTVALHKDLFAKKLSILAADSGQLISINDASFRASGSQFLTKNVSRWLIIFVVLFAIGAAIIYGLTQVEIDNSVPSNPLKKETFVSVPTEATETIPQANKPSVEPATSQDILAALNGDVAEKVELVDKVVEPTLPASANDILGAIQTKESAVSLAPNSILVEQSSIDASSIDAQELLLLEMTPNDQIAAQSQPTIQANINGEYYKTFQQGYVIQLGNYSQLSAVENMIETSNDTELHYYARMQNGTNNWVLTSKVFLSRNEADEAKQVLKEQNPEGSFWTRSLASVHADIEKHAISTQESR